MTIHHLDCCHDCGRVLHAGIFCSGCLAWSDHRPTPAVSPAPPVPAVRLVAGDTGAVGPSPHATEIPTGWDLTGGQSTETCLGSPLHSDD